MSKVPARIRFILLLLLDSVIVTCSIFVGYYILEPFFESYSLRALLLSSLILLLSHHLFAWLFDLYHRAWEYASVNELILIVKAVSASILVTALVVPVITMKPPFFRLYFITWMYLKVS
ncbi:hypothetical protein KJB81_05690 [Staphylococcus chromogenes]|uniref:hypothetical protein n=1 Tax=Staphylococcus chromogenes TaxID=46126 RepID=UPI002278CD43|nr:hypothetical protein [Staphylococcus chromogenes]MCE4966114.1 hypothetical protein [Staphylococcus chromogenes]